MIRIAEVFNQSKHSKTRLLSTNTPVLAHSSIPPSPYEIIPPGVSTHPPMDVLAALLILLLNALLQEVDAKLKAEVLLLQVVEMLRQGTVAVRHGRSGWGILKPLSPAKRQQIARRWQPKAN